LTFAEGFVKIEKKEKCVMKVILKADVKGSGKKGDLIDVSDGYAKNFLLKKGLAEIATASGINEINQKRAAEAFHKAEYIKAQKEMAAKLNRTQVTVAIKAGENGRVFGSVTTAHIAAALSELGYDIDKKKISLKTNIKNIGDFEAEIRFMEGVSCVIAVKVVAA